MKFETVGFLMLAVVLTIAGSIGAAKADGSGVSRIAAPGGEVVFANPGEREEMYDKLTYAAARRAGDFVFLSGVEAGPTKGEGTDPKAFKIQLRRAFAAIKASLVASGADFLQVVQMQTFHNCKTPNFKGDFNAQLDALIAVKSEFMKPPYSTWTAVCIDRHYSDNTVVEIQMTAYAPQAHK
jgi:enamine deaminase RidA (YjgF/YER057c/UK114 family)